MDESSLTGIQEQLVWFLDDEAFRDTERAGFRRRVITGELLQLVFWRIKGGASGSFLHTHAEHEQIGYIARGALDFSIGTAGERRVLHAGDLYLAPRGVPHGDSVFIGDEKFGECWILDVFAPPRDDLRNG